MGDHLGVSRDRFAFCPYSTGVRQPRVLWSGSIEGLRNLSILLGAPKPGIRTPVLWAGSLICIGCTAYAYRLRRLTARNKQSDPAEKPNYSTFTDNTSPYTSRLPDTMASTEKRERTISRPASPKRFDLTGFCSRLCTAWTIALTLPASTR